MIEAALSGLHAWKEPFAAAVKPSGELQPDWQDAEALGFHLLRQRSPVSSGVNFMADDLADSHCAIAALSPEKTADLASILDDLPPGSAMLRWIRCGVRRSAITRLALEQDN